jgi:hypothetical protein
VVEACRSCGWHHLLRTLALNPEREQRAPRQRSASR